MIAQTADVRTSARSEARARSRQTWTFQAGAMLFMVLFAIYFLIPLVYLIFSATKTNGDLFSTNGLWFGNSMMLGQNVHDVLTRNGGIFLRWFLNTIIYAVSSALGSTAISAMAGYALSKFRFRGREVIFAVILGAIMVPGTALVLPLFLLMSNFGLINTYWAFILPSLVNPFGVYLMRIYCTSTVPDDLIDAARVDGAGEFRTFVQIVLPVLGPALVTVLLLAFVGSWNNYFLPLVVFSDPNLFPLTLGLATWQTTVGGATQITYSLVIAAALLAVVPLVIAFLSLQRFWRTGLTLGSVKG